MVLLRCVSLSCVTFTTFNNVCFVCKCVIASRFRCFLSISVVLWKLKTIFGTWSKRMRLTTWAPHQINKNKTCAECVHLEPLIRRQQRRQDTNYHY